MSIDTMVRDEIENGFENLRKVEVGTEAYKSGVDSIAKLMDRAIEMSKFDAERQDKIDSREIETNLKKEQMADERKDRRVKNILTALGIAVPTGVTIWGTLKSLKFEETGTVTTIMGRGFISKLLPKK